MSGVTNYGSTDARVGGVFTAALAGAEASSGNMDVSQLVLTLQAERATVYEKQLTGQMADVAKRNEWTRMANAALSALRAQKPANKDDKADMGTFINLNGDKQSVLSFMKDNGIPIGGGDKGASSKSYTQDEIQSSIDNLKSSIDTSNSNSQMDQIRLQGLMEKRNQTYELLTNLMAKFDKTLSSVIGNTR
jgi:hypothetical protein